MNNKGSKARVRRIHIERMGGWLLQATPAYMEEAGWEPGPKQGFAILAGSAGGLILITILTVLETISDMNQAMNASQIYGFASDIASRGYWALATIDTIAAIVELWLSYTLLKATIRFRHRW